MAGQHVYITGGSSGLGLSLAHILALKGAHISIVARNQKKLEEAVKSIEVSYHHHFAADVRTYKIRQRNLESVLRKPFMLIRMTWTLVEQLRKLSKLFAKPMTEKHLMQCLRALAVRSPCSLSRCRSPISVTEW